MDPRVANDVERLLTTISKDRKRVPNLADVVEHLLEQWGGARQFASAYYTEYKKATSIAFRGRMLESILRLMQAYAVQAGPQEEISGLTDDDLRSVVLSLLGPFYAKQKEADARLQSGASHPEAATGEGSADPAAPPAAAAAVSSSGTGRVAADSVSSRDSHSRSSSDR